MKALLFSLLVALGSATAQAQTMYRCGKTYQDRPCAAGLPGKAMGSAVRGTPAPAASGTVPPECVQMGKDSLKVVWAREGGATQDRLLGEATSEAQRRLVRNVYPRRGSASQIQAAVEQDCVVDLAKAEQDAALAAAAAVRAQREGKLPPVPAGYQAPAAADPAAEERRKAEIAAARAEAAKQRCKSLEREMENIAAAERSGGSARTMEKLADQRRQLRKAQSDGGC